MSSVADRKRRNSAFATVGIKRIDSGGGANEETFVATIPRRTSQRENPREGDRGRTKEREREKKRENILRRGRNVGICMRLGRILTTIVMILWFPFEPVNPCLNRLIAAEKCAGRTAADAASCIAFPLSLMRCLTRLFNSSRLRVVWAFCRNNQRLV